MRGLAYGPQNLTIPRGNIITIALANGGYLTYRIILMASPQGNLIKSDCFSYTFSYPGTYPYSDDYYPSSMKGTINIV